MCRIETWTTLPLDVSNQRNLPRVIFPKYAAKKLFSLEQGLMTLTPPLIIFFPKLYEYLTSTFQDEHFGARFIFLSVLGAEIQNLYDWWCFLGGNGRKRLVFFGGSVKNGLVITDTSVKTGLKMKGLITLYFCDLEAKYIFLIYFLFLLLSLIWRIKYIYIPRHDYYIFTSLYL